MSVIDFNTIFLCSRCQSVSDDVASGDDSDSYELADGTNISIETACVCCRERFERHIEIVENCLIVKEGK